MSQQFTVIEICTEVTKAILKNNFEAVASLFSGTDFPPNPFDGQFFLRTVSDPRILYFYNLSTTTWEIFTTVSVGGDPLTILAATVANYIANTIGFVRRFANGGGTINLNGLSAVVATKNDDVATAVIVSDSSGKLIDGLSQYEIFGYNDTVFFLLNEAGTAWISKS